MHSLLHACLIFKAVLTVFKILIMIMLTMLRRASSCQFCHQRKADNVMLHRLIGLVEWTGTMESVVVNFDGAWPRTDMITAADLTETAGQMLGFRIFSHSICKMYAGQLRLILEDPSIASRLPRLDKRHYELGHAALYLRLHAQDAIYRVQGTPSCGSAHSMPHPRMLPLH